MTRRRAISAFVLVLALGAIIWLVIASTPPPEPTYQGKPLTFWLIGYTSISPSQATADAAVRQAGTNAIPTLLRLLRASDTRRSATIRDWLQRHPRVAHYLGQTDFTPANVKVQEAHSAFVFLGPQARSAVPELIRIYQSNPNGPVATWWIPDIFYELGPDAAAAAPALVQMAVNTTNALTRADAIRALGAVRAQPEITIPALINSLNDSNYYVRVSAARAFGDFGANSQSVLAALTNLLRDPVLPLRAAATNALDKLKQIVPGITNK